VVVVKVEQIQEQWVQLEIQEVQAVVEGVTVMLLQ
tara:strand:- start:335 stop:439 length:105 start_codon:yes stop_codon:yes gene_type:complete